MVNTTTPSMDLKSGAVSSSILAKAGKALQDECKTKHPDGVKVGEIAITGGHGLQVKQLYHTTLCNWSQTDSKKVGWKDGWMERETERQRERESCVCAFVFVIC